MKTWRGAFIVAVAGAHTAFTAVVASGVAFTPEMMQAAGGSAPLTRMTPGFGSAEPFDLPALAFFWSLCFGAAIGLFGLAIRALERRGPVPRSLGVALLALSLVGGVLAPASGFWLLLVPAWSLTRTG